MEVEFPKPGKYVVAVSGGVDSMVLLDLLSRQPGLELVVAHFDHGIRPDSAQDRRLVQKVVGPLSVPFVYEEGKLGPNISEATAREARYKFLRKAAQDHKAKAIITAHHQDDLIETAILNMLRGTGRKGLTALASREDIVRPLLNVSKQELLQYAQQHRLAWHEDSTNLSDDYLRNYIRHNLLSKFSQADRQVLLELLKNTKNINQELDTLLVKHLTKRLDRSWFNALPHEVAREIMAGWLRQSGLRDFDRKAIERLVVAAKTAGSGHVFPVLKGWHMRVNKHDLALQGPER